MLIYLVVLCVPGVILGRVLIIFTLKMRYLIPLSLLTIILYSLVFVAWQSWVYFNTGSTENLVFEAYLLTIGVNWVACIFTIINRRDVILKATRGYS